MNHIRSLATCLWTLFALAAVAPCALGAEGAVGRAELPAVSAVLESARGTAATAVEAAPVDPGESPEALMRRTFAEFDRLAKPGGKQALIDFRRAENPAGDARFGEMAVAETGDPALPFALQIRGKTVARMSRWLGEGKNSEVYLSERGTAIKIIRQASSARGLLMAAWVEPILNAYGIDTGRIYYVDPSGRYMEQEYIPGPSMKKRLEAWGKQPPPEIREQVLDVFLKNKKLEAERGILISFKADGFQVRPNGRIATIDFTPTKHDLEAYAALVRDRAAMSDEKFWDDFFAEFRIGSGKEAASASGSSESVGGAAAR